MRESIYGRNAVYETLRAKRRQFMELRLAETANPAGRVQDILQLAAAQKVRTIRVPRGSLEPRDVNHQGVVLDTGRYPYCDTADILDRSNEMREPPFVLLLDNLQDPQNFGSLLRTAEIVGVHGVIIPLARTVEVTPAVVHASAGASEHLLIAPSNLAQAIDTLKKEDVWIVGLDQGAPSLDSAAGRHLSGALGLVVGSEGEGLHELTRKKCDVLLGLSMHGRIASFNAAVAGSIAVYLACQARQAAAGTH